MNFSSEEINELAKTYDMNKLDVIEYLKLVTIAFKEKEAYDAKQRDYSICLDESCHNECMYKKAGKTEAFDRADNVNKVVANYINNNKQQSDFTFSDLEMLKAYVNRNKANKSDEPQPADGNEPSSIKK